LACAFAVVVSGLPPIAAAASDPASQVYDRASKSVLLLLVKTPDGRLLGQGTGFVVANGRIVTNEHVVRGGTVFVDLGPVKLPLTVERVDNKNDLAVLTASAELDIPPLSLASSAPVTGTTIYAIGNPAGLERTLSTGVVSAVRTIQGRELLQISAPISPGSSGGPILDGRGDVVGVAVGIIEKGQNLNFAVPAALVGGLIAGNKSTASNAAALLSELDALLETRQQHKYSERDDSPWAQVNSQIQSTLQNALEAANNDPNALVTLSQKARWENTRISVAAAERASQLTDSAAVNLSLGQALQVQAFFAEATEKQGALTRAETALRKALRLSPGPSAQIHFALGDVLEDRARFEDADLHFRRALELSKSKDRSIYADSLRGLARTSSSLNRPEESDTWFRTLVNLGEASSWDWSGQAKRLENRNEYREAGLSYRQAAQLGSGRKDWCSAGLMFYLADSQEDAALQCYRQCISDATGTTDSEPLLAKAHANIADVLNRRGVHQEALGHAKSASALDSTDAWAFNSEAEALLGLRRFPEAINAAKQAIRLSDGKFATMHFNLGSAYFDMENWDLARQSFEKAAELNPKGTASAYNVALCNLRLGFTVDAARWFEEVLRRDPNHKDRQELLQRIQRLRR